MVVMLVLPYLDMSEPMGPCKQTLLDRSLTSRDEKRVPLHGSEGFRE